MRTWSASAGGRLREWTFFLIVVAIAAAVIGALSLVRLSQFTIGGGRLTLVIGEALAVAGIALRVWAILTLDRFFTFVVGISADHRVVQRGPYRLLRHPGYAGALLTLLGIGIAVRNWLSLLVIVAVPALALAIRITAEEAALAGALGAEYRAYADRTARLIPRIW
jgi:protein-S-isoprenylcysteine O-methyltransferase Ste14